jgi:hypothetical protein
MPILQALRPGLWRAAARSRGPGSCSAVSGRFEEWQPRRTPRDIAVALSTQVPRIPIWSGEGVTTISPMLFQSRSHHSCK